jgi:hypothetical protein
MFISHLTFFLTAIGFLLFIIKSYNQTGFERFLLLFSFLYFSVNGVWLFLNYYSDSVNHLFDLYGVVNENVALLIPVVIVYLFRKKVSASRMLLYLILTLFIGISFSYVHYLIASGTRDSLVFVPANKNFTYNLVLQLSYDITLFAAFLFYLKKINSKSSTELFDGTYKKVFSLLFVVYYLQDMLILVLLFMAYIKVEGGAEVYNITLFLNLLMAILIIALAVYTNWLSLFNNLKSKLRHENAGLVKNAVFVLDLKETGIEIKNWRDLKQFMSMDYPDLIEEIEQFDFLSKNEKMYATLLPFELKHKELADLLCVSLRTVETNFYRLRAKLKDNNRSVNYPYNNL